jgi:hypothetical protein
VLPKTLKPINPKTLGLPASRASVHVDDPENGREHAGGCEVQVPSVEEVGAQDVVHGQLDSEAEAVSQNEAPGETDG